MKTIALLTITPDKAMMPIDEKNEKGVRWDDKDLNIKWPIKKPILSKKDKNNFSFKKYLKII